MIVVTALAGAVVSNWYHRRMAMTLRTDAELDEALTALAEAEGVSKQEAVRRAVLEKRARQLHKRRVDVIARQLVVEYDDALRRLGSV